MTGAPERAHDPIPLSFRRYAAVLGVLATVAAVASAFAWPAQLGDQPAKVWALAAFIVIGELLPIRIPRGTHTEEITVSNAFAVAFLLIFGAAPAMAVYGGVCLAADLLRRTAPAKTLVNASQSILSLAAAAAVLALLAEGPPATLGGTGPLVILAAACAFFVIDELVATTAFVLLTGVGFTTYLRRESASLTWTSGFLVTLAPLVVAAAEKSGWLVPLLFGPTLAIYLGGRHAIRSAHRALHDELTGLPNRGMLHDRLEESLDSAALHDDPVVVLLVDIDDFRAVNDTLGHEHGDTLLVQLARRLETSFGDDAELIARVGGDELAVVVSGGEADPDAIAKRTAEVLAPPFSVGGLSLEVRASLGAALFPEHADRARELVRRADIALHRAKADGTLYNVYRSEYDSFSVDRLLLAGQLRRAIAGGELVVHYQPKLALADGRPRGVEALVRWEHPELGLLAPQAFVPLAEHTGLITELTDVVLGQTLTQCAAWRRAGLDLVVAVNLSPRSLLDADLPRRIEAVLAANDLPGDALQVEITESRVVSDLDGAGRVLDQLHALGASCAIDDFGTGYSSLTQLQRLRVDEIKIDRSFVAEMDRSADSEAIVRSTIELGRSLGLAVTAEGVESEAIWSRLVELGCDYAQGFHIGHPLPAAACSRVLDNLVRRAHA
ncbi:MAG TPA: bifunctional diguanylate cyclase/phosphodiesterase [Thermoleophilaceae bacterium]|nr:bifunctional diguanylate cyclase/phosphodiesterase [Thermoleophilaceae bacterium]